MTQDPFQTEHMKHLRTGERPSTCLHCIDYTLDQYQIHKTTFTHLKSIGKGTDNLGRNWVVKAVGKEYVLVQPWGQNTYYWYPKYYIHLSLDANPYFTVGHVCTTKLSDLDKANLALELIKSMSIESNSPAKAKSVVALLEMIDTFK